MNVYDDPYELALDDARLARPRVDVNPPGTARARGRDHPGRPGPVWSRRHDGLLAAFGERIGGDPSSRLRGRDSVPLRSVGAWSEHGSTRCYATVT